MCDEGTMAEYYMDYDECHFADPVWRTKDGRVILIREMDDSHLLNTIRFLRRNVTRYQLETLEPMFHYAADAPDGAAMAVEMEIAHISDMSDDDFLAARFPVFVDMLAQVKGRGLKV